MTGDGNGIMAELAKNAKSLIVKEANQKDTIEKAKTMLQNKGLKENEIINQINKRNDAKKL